jgi:DNA polymerase-2
MPFTVTNLDTTALCTGVRGIVEAVDKGFILQAVERTHAGKTEVHLVGRMESGETFAVVERRTPPFFYVRASDETAARGVCEQERPAPGVIASDRRTMDGAPVLRLEVVTTSASQRLRDALHREGIRTYEADIKLSTQLLMDRRIHGSAAIEGEWRKGRRVGRIYENPTLTPVELDPRLSVLSIDIETDPRAQLVFAVGLVFLDPRTGTTTGEVLFNGPGPAPSASCFPSEEALLAALRSRIVDLDPDIITGWNVVDFDFRVLDRRYSARGVPFDIGRSDSSASFLDREDTDGVTRWRRSKAIVPGRQVLDGMWLVRMAGMGLEDYRLETVARSVLGRGKRIDERPGESKTAAIMRLYREEPENLCAYCLEDTKLALEILLKEGLLDLAVSKSLLIGTSLEQTAVSVAAFEFLYTEHLHERGIVAPTLGIDQDVLDRAPGGGIITPRAGLSRNVLTFDFKSLYPSIMRTFNIDPLTRLRGPAPAPDSAPAPGSASAPGSVSAPGSTRPPIAAPNGASFSREPGILAGILDRFFESREAARVRGDRRAVYAYKIVMNSFYGVLGTPGCRYAASALAGAITTLGQHILFWARDQVTASGYEVIYGDTDSLFVLSGTSPDAPASDLAALGAEIARNLNAKLVQYLGSDYGVASRMELEFEAIYRRFFLPPMRTVVDDSDEDTETRGRAKGYAGLRVSAGADGTGAGAAESEVLDIVGMEAVRHDWTPLAQELQREILGLVFHGADPGEIDELVRALMRDVRAGRKDGKLAYRKSLRKPVEAYTKSSPPHARAAALLPPEERSGLIRYVWTTDGPQPESHRTAPPDYEHYVQKQIQPIVESIAPYIGLQTDNLFAAGGQLGLF